ncbi:MAG TPA: hypothetical protein VEQ66_04530 [Propionibacteriaceae bacterium]|nr:hypothetical protein [Propionibacteriaceae bacterium]
MPESGRRQRLLWVLTGLAVAAVLLHLYGLYRPSVPQTGVWYADKVGHVVGFAAPVGLILLARHAAGPPVGDAERLPSRFGLVVVAIFALHGVVSELVQHVTYLHRTGDALDVVADWLGVGAGWVGAGALASGKWRRAGRGVASAPPLRR